MTLMNKPMQIRDELLLFLGLLGRRWRVLSFLEFHMRHAAHLFKNLPARTIFRDFDELHHTLHRVTHR